MVIQAVTITPYPATTNRDKRRASSTVSKSNFSTEQVHRKCHKRDMHTHNALPTSRRRVWQSSTMKCPHLHTCCEAIAWSLPLVTYRGGLCTPWHIRQESPSKCSASKRTPLIKKREKLPAKQRRREKYQDLPRLLKIRPESEEFSGTILTTINSANGPRQLMSIVQQYGRQLDAQHIAETLSRLAGFATSTRLTDEQVRALKVCSLRCSELLRSCIQTARPLDLARAAYSLHRLKVYDQAVSSALIEVSGSQMSSFQPDALCGLGAAIAGSGSKPDKSWLDRFCLETYIRLRDMLVKNMSSVLTTAFARTTTMHSDQVSWGLCLSFALQQTGVTVIKQPPGMPQLTAQDIANTLGALAQLGYCPTAAWLEKAQRRLRDVIPISGANPPALTRIVWALATLKVRPSFNWMLFMTYEIRTRIDMVTAKELAAVAWAIARIGHVPDPVFVEAWYKAATRRMTTFTGPSLQLAVYSVACWGIEAAPPTKFMTSVLAHAKDTLAGMQVAPLVQLLWGLVNLKIRPEADWMDMYCEVIEPILPTLTPAAITDLTWSLARLRYQPGESWEEAAATQVSNALAQFTPSQLGIVIWSWQSLQLTPPPLWRTVFLAAASKVYSAQQMQDVTALLGSLADSNTCMTRRRQV